MPYITNGGATHHRRTFCRKSNWRHILRAGGGYGKIQRTSPFKSSEFLRIEESRCSLMLVILTAALRRQGKFFYLFVAQVLLLAGFPFLDRPGVPTIFFRSLAIMAFLAGVYAVGERRAQRVIALGLATLAIVAVIIHTLLPYPRLMGPATLCTLTFLLFTLVSLLRAVLGTMEVTYDTIYGSLSVYLLMAMTWGTAYWLLVIFQPAALSIDPLRHSNHGIDFADCMFYSFVTLTSLGADIVAVSPQARSLTILENVSGVL